MAYETIILKKDGPIATLILNRPERMNAFNETMFGEFLHALGEVNKDGTSRVLILTGAGRGFCSGADLRAGRQGGLFPGRKGEEVRQELRRGPQQVSLSLRRLDIPVIGMINGPTAGGGVDWAFACDMRTGCEKTVFHPAFIKIGIFPGTGGTYLYPRIMPLAKAFEHLCTGDPITAEEAYRLGILNRLVPSEKLEEATTELATKIAEGPPIAMKLMKTLLYQGLGITFETALEMIAAAETITIGSEDNIEGVSAFREKRKPAFKGK